ncbi:MAG: helix-turn-helix domain-containing protein [Microgenomates group bacterium]
MISILRSTNMDQQDEYLTIDEAAEKLKLAKITVYRMARKGLLPAVKFGKAWRISNKKLLELFEKTTK